MLLELRPGNVVRVRKTPVAGCIRGVIAVAPVENVGGDVPEVLVYLYDRWGRLQLGKAGLPRAFPVSATRLVLESAEGVTLPPGGMELYPTCGDCAGLGIEDAGRVGHVLRVCRLCDGRGYSRVMRRIGGGG